MYSVYCKHIDLACFQWSAPQVQWFQFWSLIVCPYFCFCICVPGSIFFPTHYVIPPLDEPNCLSTTMLCPTEYCLAFPWESKIEQPCIILSPGAKKFYALLQAIEVSCTLNTSVLFISISCSFIFLTFSTFAHFILLAFSCWFLLHNCHYFKGSGIGHQSNNAFISDYYLPGSCFSTNIITLFVDVLHVLIFSVSLTFTPHQTNTNWLDVCFKWGNNERKAVLFQVMKDLNKLITLLVVTFFMSVTSSPD